MRLCQKEGCKNTVPKYFVDKEGKKHNCQKRIFCFECSPYGQHNTKNLNNRNTGICPKCGNSSQKGNSRCYKCYFKERKEKQIEKAYQIIGYKCWLCGYDRGRKGVPIMEFHHIDPSVKLFNLSVRELVGKKWNDVFKEMKKCASLCCLCHREYHAGLISREEILKIYENKWKEILGS